jgi:glycosyltransferase involved in cell wall biosynthesis
MAPARLLDLTRLLSRQGKGPMTGVDRVEAAYLAELLSLDTPVYGLLRSTVGFLLLDRVGMRALRDNAVCSGPIDLVGRIFLHRDPTRARAEAALRALAVARCWRGGLAGMLRRHLPPGSSYLNTGHSNLDDRALRQIHRAGLSISVLIHDTIPLDYPEFTRADTIELFRRKMQVAARHADLLIHTTNDARTRTELQFERLGRVPAGVVAPLGVPMPQPRPSDLPFQPTSPYFVCLGTIEPRKNHALLLDVWERLPAPAPQLYIVGRRGWSNQAVFDRLDAQPAGSAIHEVTGLGDGAVAALLQGARALLFPSLAEGTGLPAIEAAALGVPVIASDLVVFHETLGEFAVYLDPHDRYSWQETIFGLAGSGAENHLPLTPPSWKDHFNIVLSRA